MGATVDSPWPVGDRGYVRRGNYSTGFRTCRNMQRTERNQPLIESYIWILRSGDQDKCHSVKFQDSSLGNFNLNIPVQGRPCLRMHIMALGLAVKPSTRHFIPSHIGIASRGTNWNIQQYRQFEGVWWVEDWLILWHTRDRVPSNLNFGSWSGQWLVQASDEGRFKWLEDLGL